MSPESRSRFGSFSFFSAHVLLQARIYSKAALLGGQSVPPSWSFLQSPAWENSSLDVCFSVCPLLFTCWSCYVGITGFGYSGILPTLNTSSLGSDEVEAQLQRHLSASFAIGPFFGWGQNHWRTYL